MDKINVGITIAVDKETESLFSNGIKQNAIILRDTFLAMDIVNEVYFINFGKQKDLSKSPWKIYEQHMIDFEGALEKLQLIVTATQFVSGTYVERIQAKGIRLVNLVLGNEYYGFCESVLFKDDHNTIMRKQKGYNASWLTPQHFETNRDIMEVMFETTSHVCPYIWSPKFLAENLAVYEKKGKPTSYTNKGEKKRVSIFEPNINMVKTSVFPMVISEKLYLKRPELLEHINVFGTTKVRTKRHFKDFARDLTSHRDRVMTFEDRFTIVWSLLEHTDIVLAHQQDNALNYLYFDVAWLGFPLVHNAHFIKGLGWYYGGFFANDAVNHLINIIENFDKDEDTRTKYLQASRAYISQFLPTHPRNVYGYQKLTEQLF